MVKTFHLDEFGYKVEIGKVAQQADGSVWLQSGGTIILSTVVSSPSKEFPGFLPLSVDYREQFSAAGKIPGGYYKREGKPSDREVLTGRLIDRAIRPLFPYNYFNQTQVMTTVYSVDKEHTPNYVSLLATSLALTISDIPFLGPVGVVEVGRIDGKWVFDPLYSASKKSDARLIIAGTQGGIVMVEGSCDELSEDDFVDVLFMAHEKIKKQVEWQKQIQKEVGKEKETVDTGYDWSSWEKRISDFLTEDAIKNLYIEDKKERNQYLAELKQAFVDQYQAEIEQQEIEQKIIDYIFDIVLKEKVTKLIFSLRKRIDNRAFDQIRKISVEVGLLPFTHGSALFTRGQTQALVTATLGGGQDEQRTENIMDDDGDDGSFMLHYNFPPFSTGEVRPLRGTSRREVGHGHLAASAFRFVLPGKEKFPYTIRLVSDILESNGSSSMATTCGATMALMQAGVPIKKMISGIAMGLLKDNDDFIVLSDITGFEDQYGLMDFKVTGTDKGITAIQMDVKYKSGLSREVFKTALEQARNGRIYILDQMKKVMDKPNPNLSDLVPKVHMLKVDTDKIGGIIGSGGKTIREIIDATNTSIDIEPDGVVKIFGGPDSKTDVAIQWVKTLAGQIEKGSFFDGKVRRIADFGLFVELVPGLDGLVHVSNLPRDIQRIFAKKFKVNDPVRVQVVEYDEVTGRVSLRLIETEKK